MSNILVAGGGGYIGIPLCEVLDGSGHTVVAFDRWFFGKRPHGGITQLWGDIRTIEPTDMSDRKIDTVIDLAGLSNDASCEIDPAITQSINLEGGMHLATTAKRAGVKRYIYSSSCSVYGHGAHQNLKETDELHPLTLYAASKAKVEDHIRSLDGDGFETVILRNATVFGLAPRMRFDLVANIMAMNAWRDHQIVVRGGEQWRPFIHVSDVVGAFCACCHQPGDGSNPWRGTYNVGSENLTINELAREVASAAPWARIMRVTEAVDNRDYHVSFEKVGYERLFAPKLYLAYHVLKIIESLRNEEISADDPTTHTLRWYKSLIEWDKRLSDIRLDGKIL